MLFGFKGNAQCTVSFTGTVNALNNGEVTFNGTSSSAGTGVNYNWNLGDGYQYQTTQLSFSHTYQSSGTYTVCLTMIDSANNCTVYFCDSVIVSTQGCYGSFTATNDSIGNGVSFTSSIAGGADTYAWDFGDGTTSSLANPYHVYPANSSYYVCLAISSSTNTACTYTACNTVNAGPVPHAINVYEWSDSLNTICSVPASVNINIYVYTTGYSSADTIINVSVNFGDGTDTTFNIVSQFGYFWDSISHVYTSAGQYSVQCIAAASDGLTDTAVYYDQFTISNSCGNISGTVYADRDNTCTFNSGDNVLAGFPVELIQNGQVTDWRLTDGSGNYSFNVPSGFAYTVSINDFYNYYEYSSICPASGLYNITTVPSNGNDFALGCSSGFDLTGYVYAWGFRPGDSAYIYMTAYNHRCMPKNGTAKLVLDPLLTYSYSLYNPPAIISGDTLIWNFTNLNNANYWYYWNSLYSSISVRTSTNAVLGDSICLKLIIEPISGDSVPENNIQTFCFPIRNSWDPNIKTVTPRGQGASGDIAQKTKLSYSIYFQNTGNAAARNIFILDTLDTNLDMSTFKILSSSHKMTVDILPGNVLKFNFNNIMLPDSASNEAKSHGFTSYTISPKPNLTNGTQIKNTANIYFDFNSAIVTNTTLNTINTTLSINEDVLSKPEITVFPNPFSQNTSINYSIFKNARVELLLFDLVGNKIVIIESGNKSAGKYTKTWSAENLSPGMYLLQLKVDNQLTAKKIIITQ